MAENIYKFSFELTATDAQNLLGILSREIANSDHRSGMSLVKGDLRSATMYSKDAEYLRTLKQKVTAGMKLTTEARSAV